MRRRRRSRSSATTKLREYLVNPAVSDQDEGGPREGARSPRQKLEEAEKTFANDLTGQLKAASADQARLRENLQVIPQNAEPYKDFLKKFVTQEADIETLQRQVRSAETATATRRTRDYQVFLATWTAE